jgi:hypothetical protein
VRTAPDANRSEQFFTITHPFHPWRGRRFELINCRRRWGEWRVCYYTEDRQMAYLPAGWTDAGPPDIFLEQSRGRAIARVQDFLQLAELIAGRANGCVKENRPHV